MRFLWTWLLCIPLVSAQSSLGLKLPRKQWVGLGFYLAPYPPGKTPLVYESCYSDPDLFLKLPYEKNQGSLLTGTGWKGRVFSLKGDGGLSAWCVADQKGLIPELVFYKDLLEAKRLYDSKMVWLKQDYFYSFGEGFRTRKYKAKKFQAVKVSGVELSPVSQHRSILIKLKDEKGYPGFFEITMTGVNRLGPYRGLGEYCYLDHPRDYFQVKDHVWEKIEESRVILGMSAEEVALAIGDPFQDNFLSPTRTMVYRLEGKLYEFVFFKGRLDQVLPYSRDGIEMIGNQ